ncbi:VOC family protein [Kutzneria viridogrisea]|uniref:VOC domain-containing protein n=1 Tax=Kutzneria viridogrisea TaxID=47990 RepID=A0ABR6BKQ2_9PSEU|nr:hypothetical protein [Kutzneria viridogrisea]
MRMIFVNLPVRDLAASKEFFTGLGFGFNEDYCDDSAACMVVEDNVFVMLLTEQRFSEFAPGEIADPDSTEVLLCLSCASRQEVDDLAERAAASGGRVTRTLEQGPMYGRSFTDLDGHCWELMSMTPPGPLDTV